MTVERGLRLVAGVFVLLSVALAHFHSVQWLWLTAFVGLNLLQSAFTDWCPAMWIPGQSRDETLSVLSATVIGRTRRRDLVGYVKRLPLSNAHACPSRRSARP